MKSADKRDREDTGEAEKFAVKLAYVLSYRSPRYIRTESLLTALRSCVDVEVHVARNKQQGMRRYLETWKALVSLRRQHTPNVYLAGFRGHEIFWPIRWLIGRKPLIFDAMMSPYGSLRGEHGNNRVRRCLAAIIYMLERSILKSADLVLTDTQLHAEFYARTFSLPLEHFLALPVGAIESEKREDSCIQSADDIFSILFYGSFLPLHGVNVIVEAAARVADLPIRFDFIGGTAAQANELHRQCKALKITNFTHRRWVPFDQLLEREIPRADLCLGGPFGGTPQARRVVTGKTSQCMAMGKPTVIGNIDEDYGFIDRVNCLLIRQADPESLASSIRWAFAQRASLPDIGAQGRALYLDRLSTRVIAARLTTALSKMMATCQV